MLLKYLNDLDNAVKSAGEHPNSVQLSQCRQCVTTLENYLSNQMEPVRAKGHELMYKMLPHELMTVTQRSARARV